MRFWGIIALRYIKSEEITPVELMTANEWGRQPAHSARSSLKKLSSLESENHIGVCESKLFTPRSKQMGRYKLRS